MTQARSTVGNPLLWQGQLLDYDAGLYYLRARYYDPAAALFLEPDPSGFADSPNPYQAMGHNPLANRDPTGERIWRMLRFKRKPPALMETDFGWMSKANLNKAHKGLRLKGKPQRELIRRMGWYKKPKSGKVSWLEIEEEIAAPPPGMASWYKEYANNEGTKSDIEVRNQLKEDKKYKSTWEPKPARPWTGPRKRDATATANPNGRPQLGSRFTAGNILRGAGQRLDTGAYVGPTSGPMPPGASPTRQGTPYLGLLDIAHTGELSRLQTFLGELDDGAVSYIEGLEAPPIPGLSPDPITQQMTRFSSRWP